MARPMAVSLSPIDFVVRGALLLAVGIPLVYVLSRGLKLAPRPIALENPRREAFVAVLVLVVVLVIINVSNLIKPETTTAPFADPAVLLRAAILYGAALAPVVVAARATHQSWASLGLSRSALPRMAVLGLVPSAIYVPVVGLFATPGTGFAGAAALAIGFFAYAIVGFVEETQFRGYVQPRFEGAWGTWVGYAVTAAVFTLYHFPVSYIAYSGNVSDALVSTLGRFPAALLFGYIFIRSRNVVPSAIFHLFYNWGLLLWQLPLT